MRSVYVRIQILSLKQRHMHLMVNINILRLQPRRRRPKQTVPKPRLLSIITTLPPSLAVVQIVIFNNQLAVNIAQHERRYPRSNGVHAQARVAHDLAEENVRLADPPVVEGHRESEGEFGREVGQQRDDDDFDELLLYVGEAREDWDGVLREVVRSVVPPEEADFVAGAVVHVEPEVDDDGV